MKTHVIPRVVFTLHMPKVGSWNGRWSGDGKSHTITHKPTVAEFETSGMNTGTTVWYHDFGDGWTAKVSCYSLKKGERKPKSYGFCGYDWMVARILQWGDTKCHHEWAPDERPGLEKEWEHCVYCHTSRMVEKV